jgi:hypothetical protein
MPFRARLLLPLSLTLTLTAHADKPRKDSPPLPAAQYPAHDTYEQVTIAADPGDTKQTAPRTRLDYLGHGFMPIRIIVTNDSSQPLSLDDARILFVTANETQENAATHEELDRGVSHVPALSSTPYPIPIPIHKKPKSFDTQIRADDHDFGFQSSTVAPHSTAAGWLFYDVRDLGRDPLKGATIEIRKARWGSTNKALDTFDIPLAPAAPTHAD